MSQKNNNEPKDIQPKKNWTILNPDISKESKVKHLKAIKYKKVHSSSKSPVTKLIYHLREYCIMLCYFPGDHELHSHYENYTELYGWTQPKTEEEKEIIRLFLLSTNHLKKNYRDVDSFIYTDKKFGLYRHRKWLETR